MKSRQEIPDLTYLSLSITIALIRWAESSLLGRCVVTFAMWCTKKERMKEQANLAKDARHELTILKEELRKYEEQRTTLSLEEIDEDDDIDSETSQLSDGKLRLMDEIDEDDDSDDEPIDLSGGKIRLTEEIDEDDDTDDEPLHLSGGILRMMT